MKTRFITCFSLVVLATALPCLAAPTVDIAFLTRDTKPGDKLAIREPGLRLVVRDEAGNPIKKCIDIHHSRALRGENWMLEFSEGSTTTPYKVEALKAQPPGGSLATQLTVRTADDVPFDAIQKDGWRVKIHGSAGAPALTVKLPDGTTHTFDTIDLALPKMDAGNAGLVDAFKPIDHSFEVGGGDEGSIFSLKFSHRAPIRVTDDDQLFGWHAQFEGDFSPDTDDDLTIYGRFNGEAGAFRTVRIPPTDFISGSLYLDLNTRFESDQKADNYNFTLGAGVWALLGLKPVSQFSHGLYWLTNLGQKELTDPSIFLTLYAGYDYVAASEHDETAESQDKNRARFRARYRTPIWRDMKLPLMETVFDVDVVADFSAVWDFKSDRFLPEIKGSLEFIPKSIADDRLAFTLNYVSGKISPTFEDEDAFIAGLRWKL